MPEIQQSNVVDNYLGAMYGAQDRVQKQADRQMQMQRQQTADDQQAQTFQWTKEQHDLAAKTDAISQELRTLDPRDEAGFNAAKQRLLAKGVLSPEEAAKVTFNRLPQILEDDAKWRQVQEFHMGQRKDEASLAASRASTQHSLAATQVLRNKPQGGAGNIDNTTFDNMSGLRKEFVSQTKSYQDVRDAYGRIKASAQNPSAAGDMSLIFNYMKVLDPGSTVREGEFATAQQATGLPERIVNAYNNAVNGQRLNEVQRKDFVDRAGSLFQRQHETYLSTKKNYDTLAQRFNFDPSLITMDQSAGLADQPAGPPAPQPMTWGGAAPAGLAGTQAGQPAAPATKWTVTRVK